MMIQSLLQCGHSRDPVCSRKQEEELPRDLSRREAPTILGLFRPYVCDLHCQQRTPEEYESDYGAIKEREWCIKENIRNHNLTGDVDHHIESRYMFNHAMQKCWTNA